MKGLARKQAPFELNVQMIDFISITKHIDKDRLYLGNCKQICIYQDSGQVLYHLQGCERMKVFYNQHTGLLKVEGSLPYFLNGHNFSFSREELVQAVEFLDSMLGQVGLWGAIVEKFENGVIVPVDAKPKEYIARHYASASSHLKKVHNDKYGGKFEMWQAKGEDIKLYDAGANLLMKQGKARRGAIELAGWSPDLHYLKLEVRYTKPEALNGSAPVLLEKLQNLNFINMLKGNLMEQYHLLSPARALVLPSDKKNFTSLDAVLFTFADVLMNVQGLPLAEAKKQIYNTINQADCLSKSDKDARKAQIRKAFGRLEEAPESKWDLTARLEEALDKEI